jgi:hypothetical protein
MRLPRPIEASLALDPSTTTVADIKNLRKLFEYIIKIMAAAKAYGYADIEYVQML